MVQAEESGVGQYKAGLRKNMKSHTCLHYSSTQFLDLRFSKSAEDATPRHRIAEVESNILEEPPDRTMSKDTDTDVLSSSVAEQSNAHTPLGHSGVFSQSANFPNAIVHKSAGVDATHDGHTEEHPLSLRRHATEPDELRERLAQIRKEAPSGTSKFFFPNGALRRLIVPDEILTELRKAKTEYTTNELKEWSQKIYNEAPKLFAVLVWINLSNYIYDFVSEGFSDTDLPFRRCDCLHDVRLCSKKSPTKAIEAMRTWKSEKIHEFNRDQHCMLSPVFHFGDDVQHQELEDTCVLPFIEDHERSNTQMAIEGGYAFVWKIKIHPDHQIVSGQAESEVTEVFSLHKRRLIVAGSIPFHCDKMPSSSKRAIFQIRSRDVEGVQKEEPRAFDKVVGHLPPR